MKNIQSTIQKEIQKFWPQAQKSLAKLNKDTQQFMKQTEKNLASSYDKARRTTEKVILKAQREKLYYELGRTVMPILSAEQLGNKRIAQTVREIRKLNNKLRTGR
jgi:uncharacterized protein (DUF2267 family)